MRRWSYIATFCLILLTLPAWAQRRGGGGAHMASGGAASRGFAGHSSGAFRGGSLHGGSIHGGNLGRGSGVRVRIGNSYGHYGRRSYPYYPYLGYAWDFDSDTDQSDQDAYADSYAPAPPYTPYTNDSGLHRDVQGLSNKIDRLQSDVEARNHANTEQEPETALVFRDKHVEEVRNYAISGATLWVLSDQNPKRIPLAQLDLDATVKMNDDRGVDFQIPQPSLSIMISN